MSLIDSLLTASTRDVCPATAISCLFLAKTIAFDFDGSQYIGKSKSSPVVALER
jgi:hypothetical protein